MNKTPLPKEVEDAIEAHAKISKDIENFGTAPLETSQSDMLLLLHLADHRLAHGDTYHKSCLRREMVEMFRKCAGCLPEDYTGQSDASPVPPPTPEAVDLQKLTDEINRAIQPFVSGAARRPASEAATAVALRYINPKP